jgi:3-oxoadipate enol-lactonase
MSHCSAGRIGAGQPDRKFSNAPYRAFGGNQEETPVELRSNGCTFHCEIEGREDGPWVTLSHGLATDLTMWDDLVPFLAPHYRVLRYDSRGHGGSAATPGDYSLELLGQDVIGIMDALGIEKTHFVGLSMGGMVGMGLALDHADRMRSVTVCDARGVAPPEYQDAWAERSRKVQSGGIETMVEPSVTRWFTPAFQQGNPAALDKVRDMVRRTAPEGYCGSATALRMLDYERRLPDVKVPMLFLVGREDQGAPAAVMREMHVKTPGSRYAEIPDAAHISVMEQPERCAAAVLDFLDAVEPATRAAGLRARA